MPVVRECRDDEWQRAERRPTRRLGTVEPTRASARPRRTTPKAAAHSTASNGRVMKSQPTRSPAATNSTGRRRSKPVMSAAPKIRPSPSVKRYPRYTPLWIRKMGDNTMKAAAVSDTALSDVSVRASAYVPSTARSEPNATADADGAEQHLADEEHDRPAQRVLREEVARAVAAEPGLEERRRAAVGGQDHTRAERFDLPEVDGLVAVPRVRGVDPVVHGDRDDDGGQPERDERPVPRPESALRAFSVFGDQVARGGTGRDPHVRNLPSPSIAPLQPTERSGEVALGPVHATGGRTPRPLASPDDDGDGDPRGDRPGRGAATRAADSTRGRRLEVLGLALLAYVPFLLSSPGKRRGRHEAVPLPRSREPARSCALDVGPARRGGNGAPSADRLPVPDGPVLLAHGRRACPRLDRAAVVDGNDLAARGARCAMAVHAPRCAALGRARRRAGVHAHAVPARVHRAHLRAAARVGVAPVDRRPHDARGPAGRMARSGAARADHHGRRGASTRRRCCSCSSRRRCGSSSRSARVACGSVPPRPRWVASRCSRWAHRLVGDGAAPAGPVRTSRPAAHREPARRRLVRRRRST